jgi:phosphate:Na+ symporter
MLILSFLFQLFGATFLLLFAVRMVRTGIERAYGPSFKRLVTGGKGPIRQIALGMVLAVILQSSAATTLLAAGFAGSGAIAFMPAMAIVLGGDLGSALLIQILSIRLDWLAPVLLTLGGPLFLKAERRSLRQAGRIIIGIAFILIALRFLREAVTPIADSSALPALSAWFENDRLTAFLVGAALAFVMHSSVAAILMCVTLVGIGALSLHSGIALILGANLGSALIPVWLSRGMEPAARRIPLANLMLRGTAALLALAAMNAMPIKPLSDLWGPAQSLVFLHVLFNALVVLTLPFAILMDRPLRLLLPDPPVPPPAPGHRSVLDDSLLKTPVRALACLRREVLRMADVLTGMLAPVMELYQSYDSTRSRALISEDGAINEALDLIRHYVASMPHDQMEKAQKKEMQALADYAIALEAAGDIIVKRLVPLAEEKARDRLKFSAEGFGELIRIHERVLANLATASTVLVSNDVESARLLLEEKAEMGRLERSSRKKHLRRLSGGDADSFGSSDIHLETAYSLKEMNSWIVTVAHPILVREGQLLETRLIRNMPRED